MLSNVNRGHWPSLLSSDFADEGYAVLFRDVMRHKYTVNKLPQHLTGDHVGGGGGSDPITARFFLEWRL